MIAQPEHSQCPLVEMDVYYFSVYLTVIFYDYGRFDIRVNGETICTAYGETNHSTFQDPDHASCSAVALVTEGDKRHKL